MTAHDLNFALRALGPALANHLWQSTAFAAAAGLLALALRTNQAHTRHWIWMAASLKFLLPFALLAGMAAHFAKPRVVAPANPAVYSAVEDFSEPFAAPVAAPVMRRPHRSAGERLPIALAAVWLMGFIALLTVWVVRWRRVARAVYAGEPLLEGREIAILRRLEQEGGVRRPMRLLLSQSAMEPGVFGIARPVLAWPAGISARLDDAHMETVLAHEVCHVRRWDNLTAALHMFVEAAFWFHPLVWWMGARLVAERERACDEEVLRLLNRPQVYAESILKVCQFCVESPLECVAGVTGADLKKRIVEIMRARAVLRVTWGKKLLIGAAMACAIAVPVVMGQAKAAERMAANVTPEKAWRFEVVSIRRNVSGPAGTRQHFGPTPDGWSMTNMPLMVAVLNAYVPDNRAVPYFTSANIVGLPDGANQERYDISAKVPQEDLADWQKPAMQPAMLHAMLAAALAERCDLVVHRETKEKTILALVVGKGGPRFKEADPNAKHGDGPTIPGLGTVVPEDNGATLRLYGATMGLVATLLSKGGQLAIEDRTGLAGKYDLVIKKPELLAVEPGGTMAEDPEADAATMAEELGLKLEPQKGSTEILVIDHIARPTGN